MKKILYILFLFCFMTCKNNESMKMESADMELLSVEDESDLNIEVLSSKTIGFKKLEEYIDLVKLKQEHPEFESDIILQLKNYTNDSTLISFYPKGFRISNVEQLGKSKIVSDSVEHLVLGFTVTTNVLTFKDSILTEIKRKTIDLDGDTMISKKVRFLPFD